MKKAYFAPSVLFVVMAMALVLGTDINNAYSQPPPVGAPVVREGAFAVSLAEALNIGRPSSETEAESLLGTAGIAPRNGWIADYPVTPDIIGELRDSVVYAVQAKTLLMDKDAALKALENVQTGVSISVSPGPAGPPETYSESATGGVQTGENSYPDQTVINNYYTEQGPPILTYYAPPPDYYYLYSWVPYPFWWSGFWFGGFFMLNDFHRHFREHDHMSVVSNHFNDIRANRVFRIDPVNRSRGRTFAGMGAPRSNTFINTGVKGASERVFNGGPGRSFAPSSNIRTGRTQSSATGMGTRPSTGRYRAVNPFRANNVYSSPPGGGRTFTPRSGSGRTGAPFSGRTGGGQAVGRGSTIRPSHR